MKADLWELLFRANSLMRVLAQGDLSAAGELAVVAKKLEDVAEQALRNSATSANDS